jgi:hypothetical protein
MDLLTQNSFLHRKLGIKGQLQAAKFTWKSAAEQVMQALEEAATHES